MIKQGIALGMMMEVIGDQEPLVERVFPDTEAILFPIWLVAHQQLKSSKRIRVIFDLLSGSLAELSVGDPPRADHDSKNLPRDCSIGDAR